MVSPPPLSSNRLGVELIESMWISFAIATFVIAARLYTRFFVVRKVSWDDLFMITALLLTLGAFIFNNLAVNAGLGQHAEKLDQHLISELLKWAFLAQVLGIMGTAFARMAFIATLIYLLSPTQRIQLWLLRGFFILQLLLSSITALEVLLQCRPTYGLWDRTIGAVCLPPYVQERIGYCHGTVGSFADLALAIFPATVIWKMNMKRSVKASLCATMGLGVFAFAASVIKTVNLKEIANDRDDLSYTMFGVQFWFGIESSILMVCGTIPTLRALFTRRRAIGIKPFTVNERRIYQRWNGTLDKIKGPTGIKSRAACADQVELTRVSREEFGTTTDTECAAFAKEDCERARDPLEAPPETGIMKTMSADVSYEISSPK